MRPWEVSPVVYSLHGSKQEEGYPHTEFNFYERSEGEDLKVEVNERQTTQKGRKARDKEAPERNGEMAKVNHEPYAGKGTLPYHRLPVPQPPLLVIFSVH